MKSFDKNCTLKKYFSVKLNIYKIKSMFSYFVIKYYMHGYSKFIFSNYLLIVWRGNFFHFGNFFYKLLFFWKLNKIKQY